MLCLLVGAASAAPPPQLRFELLGHEQGMVNESVQAMLQDRLGFLWIGTQGGLHRYDGNKFIVFRRSDRGDALADNWVSALYEDGGGRLWVGTAGGLQRFDALTQAFAPCPLDTAPALGAHPPQVNAIIGDGARGLWLATTRGLRHVDLDCGAVKAWHHDPNDNTSIAAELVTTLVRDAAGRVWAGTRAGANRLRADGVSFDRLRLDSEAAPEPARNQLRALLADPDGALWLAADGGLERWSDDLRQRRRYGPADGLEPGAVVVSFWRDQRGRLWLNTLAGLKIWDPEGARFHSYQHQPGELHSLADNDGTTLFQDRAGLLWVGSWNRGLSRTNLNESGFERITSVANDASSLSNNAVTAVSGDDKLLWVGTFDGLNRIERRSGRNTVYRHVAGDPNSLSNNLIKALAMDADGRLWVGSNGGLDVLDPGSGRVRHFGNDATDASSLSSNTVSYLRIDGEGTLWVGTRAGLDRLARGEARFRHYRHVPGDAGSLSGGGVSTMLIDHAGRLWVGTSEGLNRLDADGLRFAHFSYERGNPSSLSHERIVSLFEDHEQVLWVGTADGLNRVLRGPGDSVRFQRWAGELGSDLIAGMLEDAAGGLWIASGARLHRLAPQRNALVSYSVADGLIDGRFSAGALHRDGAGLMYFGGPKGMVRFEPATLRLASAAPTPRLTDFQIFNQSVLGRAPADGFAIDGPLAQARRITLSSRQSSFGFEFAGLFYADAAHCRYAYMLEGVDPDWVQADAGHRFAAYNQVAPGSYRFRVKAAGPDGIWNPQEAGLELVVTPPFWKTWWFRTLALLTVLAALAGGHRARVATLVRRQRLLESTVAQRTDDVRSAMAQLKASQQQLVFQEKMTSVGTLTAGLAHEINNPANFSHAGAQTLALNLESFRSALLRLSGEDGDPQVHAYLEKQFDDLMRLTTTVVEGTTRICNLVKDLRTFTRLDEADYKAVAINDSLISTIHLVRMQYAHVAQIHTTLLPEQVIECWPAQLNQVFMNLIINACQSIDEKRKQCAQQAPGRLDIRSRLDGDALVFEFEDDGCGIAPDLLARVFEPFYTTKQVGQGTGLGLSISFGIIERHRGSFSVRSTPGVGSCFCIRLPLKQAP